MVVIACWRASCCEISSARFMWILVAFSFYNLSTSRNFQENCRTNVVFSCTVIWFCEGSRYGLDNARELRVISNIMWSWFPWILNIHICTFFCLMKGLPCGTYCLVVSLKLKTFIFVLFFSWLKDLHWTEGLWIITLVLRVPQLPQNLDLALCFFVIDSWPGSFLFLFSFRCWCRWRSWQGRRGHGWSGCFNPRTM